MKQGLLGPLVVLALCGCTSSPTTTPSPSPSAPPTASGSASATAEPATPTAEPTATPFGAGVFADPDDCTNDVWSYRVAYPATWYSNAAVTDPFNPSVVGVPACSLFAPHEFEVLYGTELPHDIAMWIRLDELPEGAEWNYGPFSGYTVLTDSEAVVDGYPARVREIEVTLPNLAYAPGDRFTEYVIQLSETRYLLAQTYSQQEYDTSTVTLDQMMETLVVTAP